MGRSDSKKRPLIGLFDSGRGGLSVWQALLLKNYDVDYFYIADLAHAPYGNKPDHKIMERSHVLCERLLEAGVDLILVACNTATAVAIDELRQTYSELPFVGVEPYLTAAQHHGWQLAQGDRQVVLVTPLMAQSARFKQLRARRDPGEQILVHPCPTMAALIDQALDIKDSLRRKELIDQALEDLAPLKDQALRYAILGCTHYPLIRSQIEEYLQLKALCPGAAVATRVGELLSLSGTGRDQRLTYWDTRGPQPRELSLADILVDLVPISGQS